MPPASRRSRHPHESYTAHIQGRVTSSVQRESPGANVQSTEEVVSKGDQDKLTIEEESKSSIQENIPVNSDLSTSYQEAAISNRVLGKPNKDIVQTIQEESVQIDVQTKVKR